MERTSGPPLHIPFSALAEVGEEVAVLCVQADAIARMQWDVLPDFLNIHTLPDSQGDPGQA